MTDVVTTRDQDGIRIITLNNPPVNALSVAVVTGLRDAVEAAAGDDGIEGMVVTGAGSAFIAGADIREFGKPRPKDAPTLHQVLALMDGQDKPVVAALNGVALGGGLEVALACNYRVATTTAQVGLPEVNLGIIPGAGGTQRLPRVAGVEAALDMITGGRPVGADKARALGIVDAVADGDVVAAAVDFAKARIAAGGPHQRISAMDAKIAEARRKPAIFDDYRDRIAKSARGFDAPWACIEAVEAAVELPFDQGLKREREIFERLVAGDKSAAQRYAFFGERAVARVPDIPKDTPVKAIKRAGVIGCGTMGGGIAMNFANAGIPVTVVEVEQAALDNGLARIRANYDRSVKSGRFTAGQVEERVARITGTTEMAAVADVDMVIEAVVEKMDVKKQVFARLDEVCKPGAILATNTSTLDIDQIASATGRPEAVCGTHFFSPANVMKLMENVRGAKSSKETLATVMAVAKKIGKVGVLVGNCDGFVGNRMLYAYSRQANFLLEEGALPQQVDKVIYDFGFPMGPFAMSDLAGVDVGYYVRQEREKRFGPTNKRTSKIADRLFEMGRYGQKTAKGWYRYEEGPGGSRTGKPDPEVEAVIVEESERLGIARREIADDEILERCLYPLVNEGALILEEGIAARPVDIDMVWLFGYGFPRYRGGPMFWADLVGLDKVVARLETFQREHDPDWIEPAPLLRELAKAGKGFKDYVA
jgi:3-hydroxyacyl-CoA dehydrogenase